jgi:ribosome biogenesis protein MAK21
MRRTITEAKVNIQMEKLQNLSEPNKAAEELFDVDDDDEVVGDDENDNEEIDNMLDPADLSLVAENE